MRCLFKFFSVFMLLADKRHANEDTSVKQSEARMAGNSKKRRKLCALTPHSHVVI